MSYVLNESYGDNTNNIAGLFESYDHLSKVCVENCAEMAYNDVVFEAALSDEILSENDAWDNAKKGAGNTAFKVIETIKRVASNIFNKIRVAINEFIKDQNEKKTAQKFKDAAKAIKDTDKLIKIRNLDLEPEKVFPVVLDIKALAEMKDEKKAAQSVANEIKGGLKPSNFEQAIKALNTVETFADVSRVVGNIASYANSEKLMMSIKQFDAGSKAQRIPAWTKSMYNSSVAKSNDFIKTKEKEIKYKLSESEIKDLKDEVRLAEKVLSLIHAAYLGALKWSVAYNKECLSVLKGTNLKAENESAFAEFTGLQLL